MVEKSHDIPVSLELLPQLEAKISAVKQWRETARKAFISTKNPCSLLEVLHLYCIRLWRLFIFSCSLCALLVIYKV